MKDRNCAAYRMILQTVVLFAVAMALLLATKTAEAAEPGIVKLDTTHTYTQYDVTGDGVADEFCVSYTYFGGGSYFSTAKIYINGKCAKTITPKYAWSNKIIVNICTLKNGKKYLLINDLGEDGDAYVLAGFYEYKSGKLKQVLDLKKELSSDYYNHFNIDDIDVSGNVFKVKSHYMTCILGSMDLTYNYKYKNGTLERTSNVTKTFSMTKKKGTLNYSRAAYNKPSSTTPSFTFTKGTKVKAVAVSIKNKKLYVKLRRVSDGATGWVRGVTYSEFEKNVSEMSRTLISGNFLAG